VRAANPKVSAASALFSREESQHDKALRWVFWDMGVEPLLGELAERLAASSDPAEIIRLRSAVTRGFYGE